MECLPNTDIFMVRYYVYDNSLDIFTKRSECNSIFSSNYLILNSLCVNMTYSFSQGLAKIPFSKAK